MHSAVSIDRRTSCEHAAAGCCARQRGGAGRRFRTPPTPSLTPVTFSARRARAARMRSTTAADRVGGSADPLRWRCPRLRHEVGGLGDVGIGDAAQLGYPPTPRKSRGGSIMTSTTDTSWQSVWQKRGGCGPRSRSADACPREAAWSPRVQRPPGRCIRRRSSLAEQFTPGLPQSGRCLPRSDGCREQDARPCIPAPRDAVALPVVGFQDRRCEYPRAVAGAAGRGR